jgi:hypothetical protein
MESGEAIIDNKKAVSDKTESVLSDEPSAAKTAVEVINTGSLQGIDTQFDSVGFSQLDTQVCETDSVKDEDKHIPFKFPEAEEGAMSKEQAFQLLLNVLTGNYSDIPQVKAFKDSLMAAISNPSQTNQSEPCTEGSAQQEQTEALGEAYDITHSEPVFGDNYVSDNPLENNRLTESANTSEDMIEQSKVLSKTVVNTLENVHILNPSPEPKITLESTDIQPDFTVKQGSPKLELSRNLDINIISMDETLDVIFNSMKTEQSPVQRSAETVRDKDAQCHVQKDMLQGTGKSAPFFEELCTDDDDDDDNDDDDYEEYVTNDEMDEEDYDDEDEEENEEIKLIMENIIAINESSKCSTGHENILNLQYVMPENQVTSPRGPEIVTDNTAVSDHPKEEEIKYSVNIMTNKAGDVSASNPQEIGTENSPNLQTYTMNGITPSTNTQSPRATLSTLTSTTIKAPIPPKRKLAKGIRNPPGVTILTTSNNNETIKQNNTTELTQSRAPELHRTNSSNHSPASVKEHSSTVSEQVQSTAQHPVDSGSLEKQEEITSQTTDVSNKVIDQLQFEVSLKIEN